MVDRTREIFIEEKGNEYGTGWHFLYKVNNQNSFQETEIFVPFRA